MEIQRWQRLDALFHAALALPEPARGAFLDSVCADDAVLRDELAGLLASHAEGGVLDRPPPLLDDPPTTPQARASVALPAGARLGPYEVVALLGAGGMGEVYRARDPRLGREVAIKRVRGSEPGVEALRRFDREARAAGALNHPNLLAVYDVGIEAGMPYVVTELLEGETLRQRLRCGPIPADEALRIGRQIASGLAAAHEKGIVHRDLKPENLFLTLDGRVKILDFGLAKRLVSAEIENTLRHETLTGAGLIVGTLGYTSPEQLRGLPPEPRSDLFSLGAVLYEMLSGRRAFGGANALEAVSAVLTEEPPPFPPGIAIAAPVERLVRRCLAKRPEERPASVRELLVALDEATAERPTSPARGSATSGVRPAEQRSLAVLPFLNLTGDAGQEYFCEGIAEELLHALGTVPELRVAARSSSFRFQGQEDAIRRLGQELHVDTVLEGSVRKAGERLRIAVQLIAVADSCHLWSERYDLAAGDVFAVQDEIASRIAAALRLRLAGGSPVVHRPANLEAYHLYLKGRYLWNKRHAGGLLEGVRAFEQALEHDPAYARAWAGLADSYGLLGLSLYDVLPTQDAMPRAKAAALKALEIDPTLPEAYAALAWVRFHHDWDWGGAEHDFRRSLELGPSIATTRHWYSFFLSVLGRADEAQEQAQRAWQLDPLSLIVNANLAQPAYYARRYGESVAAAKKLTEMEPGFAIGHHWLGLVLAAQGRHGEAIAAFEAFGRCFGPTTRATAYVAHSLARRGQTDDARAAFAELDAIAADRPVPAYHRALIHLGLDERDAALAELERAAEEGSDALAYLAVDPYFDPLRDEPRFLELLRRTGLDGVAARLHLHMHIQNAGMSGGGRSATLRAPRSLAVLPFRELAGEGDESAAGLGLGLADATITELAGRAALVVRPTSTILAYQGGAVDPLQAGRELGVDTVLAGEVARRGGRLHVAVRLLAVEDGSELWAARIESDAEDLFATQDEVSRQVAAALSLSPEALAPVSSARQRRAGPAGRAYDLYLQGKAHLLRETLSELVAAIDLFERSRAADPAFAPAWAGLADAYGRMAFNFQPEGDWYRRAEEMCEQALALDPASPEGLYARARLRWSPPRGWDHEGAMRDLCAAIRARPGFDEAHIRLGTILYHVGLIDLGMRHFEQALAMAPEHGLASYQLGFCRYHLGRYQEALEITEAQARHAPSVWILYQVASCQLRLGRLADAEQTAKRIAQEYPGEVLAHPLRGLLAARRGDAAEAREQARLTAENRSAFGHYHHAQYDLACIHTMLDEPAAAVRELEAAALNGYPCATLFESDPLLAPLHGDAAFAGLLERLRRERLRFHDLYRELLPAA
ncbi:MAG TPA: protein kinase [Thermoanaerobaculia bacterium]|jgi:serine/threonine-protein kinase|nr:protein kinase [Thermoanaerobaculia bacterium]